MSVRNETSEKRSNGWLLMICKNYTDWNPYLVDVKLLNQMLQCSHSKQIKLSNWKIKKVQFQQFQFLKKFYIKTGSTCSTCSLNRLPPTADVLTKALRFQYPSSSPSSLASNNKKEKALSNSAILHAVLGCSSITALMHAWVTYDEHERTRPAGQLHSCFICFYLFYMLLFVFYLFD